MSKENKTQANNASVTGFIDQVPHPQRQADSRVLLDIFQRVTEQKPVMWGESIVGYGSYHYHYASGRQGDFLRTGFSPRKANLSIYIMLGFSQLEPLLNALGKHKTTVSCLYINKLADVDLDVLEQIIQSGWEAMKRKYPC